MVVCVCVSESVFVCVFPVCCRLLNYACSLSVCVFSLCVYVCVSNLSMSVSGTVLLLKQGWPQASPAPGGPEGSYDLAMDGSAENRQYQAASAAFSKYEPYVLHTNTHPHTHTRRHTHLHVHTRTHTLT